MTINRQCLTERLDMYFTDGVFLAMSIEIFNFARILCDWIKKNSYVLNQFSFCFTL